MIPKQASRLSGVAPLSVFFNADLIESTPTNREFHNNHYTWDFGDAGAGKWFDGKTKNGDTGACASHVFEAPGTYTVISRTYAPGHVLESTDTYTITVEDPDVVFLGTLTTCVNNVGDLDFIDAPVGSNQINTDDLTTLPPYADAGMRLLFKRGGSWNHTADIAWVSNDGPVSIGAYGAVTTVDAYGIAANAPAFTSSGGLGVFLSLSGKTGWRIADLTFSGATDNYGVIGGGIGDSRDNLMLRLKATGYSTPVGNSHWRYSDADSIVDTAVVSCRLVSSKGMVLYIGSQKLTVMGNEFKDSEDTHVTRIWWSSLGVYSHNSATDASNVLLTGRHALKLHAPQFYSGVEDTTSESFKGDFATVGNAGLPEFTRFTVISNNTFGSSGPWPVSMGPQDSLKDERVLDIIFEKNRYINQYTDLTPITAQIAINYEGRYGTIRNNIIDITGGDGGVTGIKIYRRGVEWTPLGNEVYNNTIYRGTDAEPAGNTHTGIAVDATAIDTIIRNNLVSFPYVTGPKVLITDDSGIAVTSNNLLTDTPYYYDPDNINPLTRDFRLTYLSQSMIDLGFDLPQVQDDFAGTVRSGDFDLGAIQYLSLTAFQKPNKFNGSNNKYKYPVQQELIDADLINGEYMYLAGVPVAKSEGDLTADGIMNFNQQMYGCFGAANESGIFEYSAQLTGPQDDEARAYAPCLSKTNSLDFSVADNSQYTTLI